MSEELGKVDDSYPKVGIRHERVSMGVEQLVKAKAFLHFLAKGACRSRVPLDASVPLHPIASLPDCVVNLCVVRFGSVPSNSLLTTPPCCPCVCAVGLSRGTAT